MWQLNLSSVWIAITLVCLVSGFCPPEVGAKEDQTANLESFDLVWKTVKDEHFDPNFDGIVWQERYDRYRPLIEQAQSHAEFATITNRMLFELNLSHLAVFSEQDLKQILPTLFAEASTGVELRLIDHQVVVFRVRTGSSGEAAGLRSGDVVSRINGHPVAELLAGIPQVPPYNRRNQKNVASNSLVGRLDGMPGSTVKLVWRDQNNQTRRAELIRQYRGAGQVVSGALPPIHVEFETKLFPENIAYIWFNHFAPPVDTVFTDALSRMQDSRGLIIDLRGNPGGYFETLDRIAEQLLRSEVDLYRLEFRDRTVVKRLNPVAASYRKPLVILIDETSLSCSELFASSLQAIGRATLVGQQTPGYLLGAKWLRLPNNLSFIHTNLLPIPAGGQVVENRGVIPDIDVSLRRETLLEQRRDSQLLAAVKFLLGQ